MRFAKPALKGLLTVAIFGVVVLIPLKIVPMVQHWLEERQAEGTKHATQVQKENLETLAQDEPDTLIVLEDVQKDMSLTVAQVKPAVAPEPLKLDGALYLLQNSMVHVHSRFPGDVVEVGRFESPEPAISGAETPSIRSRNSRPLQYGDFVRKGNLLAVVWSKELGEKKSELVDGLARLRIDEARLKDLEDGEKKGAISSDKVREQRRLVQSDVIDVDRAERTLRSWQISEAEIASVRAEAGRIHDQDVRLDGKLNENWARVEIRAVVDGTIVEKNVAVGDYISNDLDLFKIADMSRMDVMAHAYEEDVPLIERIPKEHRDWTIYLKGDPQEAPLKGSFDRVLPIIDPTQHTALVRGWVENSRGRLRVGQFITAWVNLPVPDDEVSIPVAALVDQDSQTFVFVRSASDPTRFTRRKVFAVRRRDDIVSLSCHSRQGTAKGTCDVDPLMVGDWVVTTGGLELASQLTNLQSQSQSQSHADSKGTINAVQK